MKVLLLQSEIGLMYFCEHPPDLASFLSPLGVRAGSYAEEFAVRLYWHLWAGVYDLGRDYKTFYCSEYETFADYLRKKHACRMQTIRIIEERLACSGRSLRVWLRASDVPSEYNMEHFMEDYGFSLERAAECLGLEMLGGQDEDQT